MALTYHFDLYPRTNPNGARLVRFTNLQAAEYRGEANGTGAGRFSIRADDAEAAFIDPEGLQYVRVVRDDGATELVVGGFFLDSGDYAALNEDETKLLTWGGAGTLSYLGRAVMDADSWIDDPFIGTDPQPEGVWPLHLAGTGNELGAILWRVLHEVEEPGRHQDPLPLMTLGFTYLVDSNAAAWVRTTGDFTAQVGENVISIIRRLMQMGLYVEVDPDDFEVRAYEPETHRRDRTGVAWGADIVRFQSPTDGTIATGNIKSDAKRGLEAKVRRNAVLVGAQDSWLWVDDVGVTVPWEGSFIVDDDSGSSLLKFGEAQLAKRSDAGDTLRLRMKLGDDEANGVYLPFEHVLLDDIVTVHTGTGQWDYNEAEFPVAALTIALRPGGDWDAWADLGSTYLSMAERAFQAQPVGAHTHPPNPQLCRAITAVQPTVSYLSGWQSNVYGFTTVPAGTNRMLIAVGMWPGHGIADWYGTYDGNPMTPLGSHVHIIGATESHLQAFYVLDPTEAPGGLGPQVGVFGTDVNSNPYPNYLHYIVLNGVNPLDPVAAVVSAFGTGTLSGPGAIPQGGVESIGFMFGTGGDASHDAPVEVATFTDGWSYGSNVYSISAAAGYGAAEPEWSHLGSEVWAAMGIAVNGFGTSAGDGHADLIGTSVRAKRCDDTEHYHTTADPTVNDDTTIGFRNNTLWINESTGAMFLLLDNADGAADWLAVGGGGADLSGINFLVGTGSGDLSAEIVVGTTPGGELGNTWASPTVDATHSGSTHSAATDTHIADATDAHDASAISFTPNGSIAATDVQAAIQEVRDEASGSALTIEDEGTPLATAATTLDFVGAGVVASGAGAEKTITISGASVADILDLPTAETDDTLVLAPDGAGGVEFRAETGGGGSPGRPLVDPTGLSWSWANQGSATIATQGASLLLYGPADAADSHRMRLKTVPSKPYEIIVHGLPGLLSASLSGVWVGWTSATNFTGLYQFYNASLFTNSTKGALYAASADYMSLGNHNQYWEWIKLTDTAGGNRTISVSRDGYNWILLHSVATDDYLTPTDVGFSVNPRNGTYAAALTIDSWEEA